MDEIHRISDETIEEFVKREGPVTTSAVAHRFGYDRELALRFLKNLEKAGKLVATLMPIEVGRGYGWDHVSKTQPFPDVS